MDKDYILSRFPLYVICAALHFFETHEVLLSHEETAVINFTKKFTTCTLNSEKIRLMINNPNLKDKSGEVIDIVKQVNIHNLTKTCR